jgi:hypothetical protein
MLDFLKTKGFHKLFSFLIGVFVVIIFRRICKDKECIDIIMADPNVIKTKTYMIGNKCYVFTPKIIKADKT